MAVLAGVEALPELGVRRLRARGGRLRGPCSASTTSSVVASSGPGAEERKSNRKPRELLVGGQVRHQEQHRDADHADVEAQRGVVEDGRVGRQDQVVDLRVVGDVQDARAPGPFGVTGVEPVAAQQHHVVGAEVIGQRGEVEVGVEPGRAVVRGQGVPPGRRVEHGRLVRPDPQPSACVGPHLRGVGREERVVARIALVDDRALVGELAPVVLRHLRAGAHQQGPAARAVLEVLLDPAGGEPVGAPEAEAHHLAGVAVPGLEQLLAGAAAEPALHLDVGDDPVRPGEGVVPLPAAEQHRLGALGHRRPGVVDAPPDPHVGSQAAQALVDRERAVGGMLAGVGLEVGETGVHGRRGGGVVLLEAALRGRSDLVGAAEVLERDASPAVVARPHGEPVAAADELDGRTCRQVVAEQHVAVVERHGVAAQRQGAHPQAPRVCDQPEVDGAVGVGRPGDRASGTGHAGLSGCRRR